MNFFWDIRVISSMAYCFFGRRFFNNLGHPCSSYKCYSVWPGLRPLYSAISNGSKWIIGLGGQVKFGIQSGWMCWFLISWDFLCLFLIVCMLWSRILFWMAALIRIFQLSLLVIFSVVVNLMFFRIDGFGIHAFAHVIE